MPLRLLICVARMSWIQSHKPVHCLPDNLHIEMKRLIHNIAGREEWHLWQLLHLLWKWGVWHCDYHGATGVFISVQLHHANLQKSSWHRSNFNDLNSSLNWKKNSEEALRYCYVVTHVLKLPWTGNQTQSDNEILSPWWPFVILHKYSHEYLLHTFALSFLSLLAPS